MARTDTLGHFLTDVADAIRTKTGSEATITASEFDTAIGNIPSGGGGGNTINFIQDAYALSSIQNPSEGDYAIVYNVEMGPITKTRYIDGVSCPKKIVLDKPIDYNYQLEFRPPTLQNPTVIDTNTYLTFNANSRNINIGYSNSFENPISIDYASQDGLTYETDDVISTSQDIWFKIPCMFDNSMNERQIGLPSAFVNNIKALNKSVVAIYIRRNNAWVYYNDELPSSLRNELKFSIYNDTYAGQNNLFALEDDPSFTVNEHLTIKNSGYSQYEDNNLYVAYDYVDENYYDSSKIKLKSGTDFSLTINSYEIDNDYIYLIPDQSSNSLEFQITSIPNELKDLIIQNGNSLTGMSYHLTIPEGAITSANARNELVDFDYNF